jgi:uncharacterized membrane protein YgdD (TMEM256/DUF423 family)
MNKNLAITCIFGLIAITFGAFTTHGLQDVLTTREMSSLETGIRYQIYHVIVLLFVNTHSSFSIKLKNYVSYVFFFGIVLFSGSIYSIHIFNFPAKSIWFVTPLGGLLFLIGWVLMTHFFLFKIINKKNQ